MPLEGFDDIDIIPKHAGGRPPKEIDYAAIERAASIGCSKEEIAAVLGIGRTTLYAHMENEPEIQEAIDRGLAKGKATLRRFQWNGAQEGNATMLIWLGKQMLGQRDKNELTGADGQPLISAIRVTFVRPEVIEGTLDE